MELTIDNFTYSIGKNRDIKFENGIYYFKCCKCGKYKPVEEFEKDGITVKQKKII